jgi:Tol biopolymer transport system component
MDLSSIPKTISPAVRHTLKLCLEKDPRKRIADIRDVRLALEGALEMQVRVSDERSRAPLWRRALPFAATLIVGGVIVGLGVLILSPEAEPLITARFEHEQAQGQAFRNPGRDVVALSPDGRNLVINTTDGLYLRMLGDLEARLLPGTEGALTNPVFSPDGEWIAYWTAGDGQLKKIRLSGGSPVTLAPIGNPQGATWTDDNWIVFGQSLGLMRVSANGGTPEMLIESGSGPYWDPQVLPDGSILYTDWSVQTGLIAIETPGAGDRIDLFAGERAIYIPTGHIVSADTAADGTLFVRSFDLTTRSYGGPVSIEEGIWSSAGKHHFTISDTGTLAFATGAPVEAAEAVLAIVNREGGAERLNVEAQQFRGPRVSPDGTQVAVEIIDDGGRSSIWIYDLTGERAFRPLLGAGSNMRPIWTPDGQELTFASNREGTWGIYSHAADGSGVARRLTAAEPGVQHWPDSWAPDSQTLAFTRIDGDLSSIQSQSLWTMALDENGEPTEPVVFYPNDAGGGTFSPNGQWLSYRTNDPTFGGSNQVHVQPFPQTGAIYSLAELGGSYPTWSRDGDELVYRRPSTGSALPLTLGVVDVTIEQGFAWGNETEIPIPGGIAFFGFRDYDLMPDGERLVAIVANEASVIDTTPDGPTIQLVTNWFELVKERAPVR